MSCNFILNFLPLVQGSVNYAPQTKSNMWLVFVKKKKFYWKQSHSFLYIVSIAVYLSNWHRDYTDSQSLKYLLSGCLEKNFANPCMTGFLILVGRPCTTVSWNIASDLLRQVTLHFPFPWSLYSNQAGPVPFLFLADKTFFPSLSPSAYNKYNGLK